MPKKRVLTGLLLMMAATLTAAAPPLNILLITGDDLGNYLGCYGDPIARTPRMDSIAKNGVRFDNAWVAQASCSPSRSAIMTGLYPHQNGQIGLAHLGFNMSKEWPTIPSVLNKAGYFTGLIGKLHVKPESAFPFGFRWDGKRASNRNPRIIGEQVERFLEKSGDKPFYLHASFYDPHRPFLADVGGYPKDKVTSSQVKLLPFMRGLEDVAGLADEVAGYYNCIARMDACVGVVLDKLKAADRLKNTLIILIGDHGAPFGRAKVTCYNPGMRIPFLVRWPGVSKGGSVSEAMVSTIDILPTFADAAGAALPHNLPGTSLRPLLANPAADGREYMFGEFTAHLPVDYYPRRTVRDKRYQLIHNLMGGVRNPTPGIEGLAERDAVTSSDKGTSRVRTAVLTYINPPEFELYDLEKDPENFENLAGKPEYAGIQKRLDGELEKWRQEMHDPLLNDREIKKLGDDIKSRLDVKYSGIKGNKDKN